MPSTQFPMNDARVSDESTTYGSDQQIRDWLREIENWPDDTPWMHLSPRMGHELLTARAILRDLAALPEDEVAGCRWFSLNDIWLATPPNSWATRARGRS